MGQRDRTVLSVGAKRIVVAFVVLSAATASFGQSVSKTVQGTAGPWSQAVNPSFNYSVHDNTSPVTVDASDGIPFTPGATLTITYVSGLVSTAAGRSFYDANGGPNNPTNTYNGFNGRFPAFYMDRSVPVYTGALVGTFAQDGVIVGTPFLIGDGPVNIQIPIGSNQLLLGVNDNFFSDNRGAFTVAISTSTVPTLVDPVPDLLIGGHITTAATADPSAPMLPYLSNLAKGRTVQAIATDGVAQVVIRIPASSVGEQFELAINCSTYGLAPPECINQYGLLFDPTDPPTPSADLFGNTLPQNVTVTAVPTQNGPMAFAAYRAPVDFVRSGDFNVSDAMAASRTFVITINNGQQPSLSMTLVRPPLILLHGFNTGPEAWDTFVPLVNETAKFAILKANYGMFLYGRTNGGFFKLLTDINIAATEPPIKPLLLYQHIRRSHLGFSFNSKYVANDIQTFLTTFVLGNNPIAQPVAAIKVDVVAHSMGGLVARYLTVPSTYLASNNYNQGYLHKLITLGTPHFGSPQAILSLLPQSQCSRYFAAVSGSLSISTASLSPPRVLPLPGATGELSGDGIGLNLSKALKDLGTTAARLNANGITVPIAALAGDIESIKLNVKNAPAAYIPEKHCGGDPLAERLTPAQFDTIFDPLITSSNPDGGAGGPANPQNGRESDGSVPLTSALMNPEINSLGLCASLQCFDTYSHSVGIAALFGSLWSPLGGGIHFLQDDSLAVSTVVEVLLNTPINNPVFGGGY